MMERLEIVYIEPSKLVRLEGNPRRKKDMDAVKKLQKLIESHGFQNPLQVYMEQSGQYSILCGNHRFDAGLKLGMSEFPCLIYTGDRQSAIARAISDNKSGEWTEWDFPALKDIMAEFDDGAVDMAITGFSPDEIAELFDRVNFEPGTEDEQGRLDEKEPIICPECGHSWTK